MPGPPDRFELSVWERLNPIIMAIGRRVQRAEERRRAIMGDLRGLTPEESAHLGLDGSGSGMPTRQRSSISWTRSSA